MPVLRDKADNPPGSDVEQSPAAAASSGLSSPVTVLGDFEVRRVIGRGGMGTVYEAWQRSLARPVALKVLAAHIAASPKAIRRFQREAQAAAKLHHTHIIPIFAQGDENGVYYYAMELIEGRSLNAIITETRDRRMSDTVATDLDETVELPRARKPRDPGASDATTPHATPSSSGASGTAHGESTVTTVLSSAEHFAMVARHIASTADALEYAHREGVVHRDIKPHNLMMGDDGRLRIADFGLARVAEQPGVTVTGEMVGSPLYMSPEQIAAGPTAVDYRTDIYSLGATMYEWLTLTPPHPGETREAVISKILSADPLPLRSHNLEVPVDLETICLKAIARDPVRRYRTAAEFREDLHRYLEHRPIKARRAGLVERARKFVGRHQIASLAAAAAVVAIGLVWALYSSRYEVQTQTAAAEEAQEQYHDVLDMLTKVFPVAGAAVSGIEDIVETGQAMTLQQDEEKAPGASVEAAATPEGIALRASREIYQALAPTDFPSSSDGDKYGALLVSALEARKEDPERALQLLDLYLLERGDDIAALQFQAALRGQLKHYVEMAEAAEQLVRLQGDDPIAYLWRGLARLLLNRIEPCLEDFSRAKGFDATATWAEALQGLALIRLGQPTDGIAALDRALAGSPNMVVAILGRASAYRSMADLTAAVGELNRVIELEPDNANALAARGEDHRELGNLDAAKQDFEQAMALAGRSPTMVMRYLSVVSQKWEIQQAETAEAEARRKAEEEKPPDEASKQRILDWFSQYVWP